MSKGKWNRITNTELIERRKAAILEVFRDWIDTCVDVTGSPQHAELTSDLSKSYTDFVEAYGTRKLQEDPNYDLDVLDSKVLASMKSLGWLMSSEFRNTAAYTRGGKRYRIGVRLRP